MAYRFDNVNGNVQFAIAPFGGHVFGAFTWAIYAKFNGTGNRKTMFSFATATDSIRYRWTLDNGNFPELFEFTTGGINSTTALASTSVWYLIVITKPAGTVVKPRIHVYDGTAWAHADMSANTAGTTTIASDDKLKVGLTGTSNPANSDIVCAAIKYADATDATVQTLSPTSFPAWQAFGFDWLAGFQAAGTITNRANPGSGDEIARSGVTLVSDPPGWLWVAALVPVADFTGTPLTGTSPLSVTFTDSSTNTPTSWLWDFGDGTTSTAQNPTHSYTSSGVYTVSLTATNATGSNTKTRTGYITATEAIAYVAGGGVSIW